ncbi:MAG: BatD family protein [Candidatus Margulisiibacteriota bacterium]|nr:BatD family protein [Candidatus Margulisiibacteriota bacterium]
MVKNWFIILFSWLFISINISSKDVEILATVNKSKVYLNEQFILTLTVKGADRDIYKSIELPDLKENFSIISTSQSSSFSYVNGVANRTRQYKYTMLPSESGIFIIDPFKVAYKGKKLTTRPLRVVVRKGTISANRAAAQKAQLVSAINTPQQNKLKSIFLETQVSTNNIFIGESIDYSIKLYRRISLWSSISIDQDDLQGVWQTSLETSPERVVRKFSQRYYELELVRKKIRPLADGELSIPQLSARFVVDPFSGEYQLVSEIVTINVLPLPDPKPVSFTGAIGNYQMMVSDPIKASDQNTYQIQIIVEGSGTLTEVSAPIIPDTTEYRVLTAPQQKEDIASTKHVFDYVIIPKNSGKISIPPIEFSYFSKETMSYVTLASNPFELDVELLKDTTDLNESFVNQDIQFLKDNTSLQKMKAILSNSTSNKLLILINLALILVIIFNLFKHKVPTFKDNKFRVRRNIIQRVQNLNPQSSIIEMQQLFVEVLNTFSIYSKPSVEASAIESALIKAELSDPLIKSMMQWIKTSQVLQFSKEKQVDQAHSSSDSLKRILNEIIKEVQK